MAGMSKCRLIGILLLCSALGCGAETNPCPYEVTSEILLPEVNSANQVWYEGSEDITPGGGPYNRMRLRVTFEASCRDRPCSPPEGVVGWATSMSVRHPGLDGPFVESSRLSVSISDPPPLHVPPIPPAPDWVGTRTIDTALVGPIVSLTLRVSARFGTEDWEDPESRMEAADRLRMADFNGLARSVATFYCE